MTINEIVSYIQNIYNKGPKTDETELSDRMVYEVVKKVRAKLIKQKADKFNKVPDFYYQSVDCFPLELEPLIDCGCVDTGCRVLKSTYEVPLFVTGRNRPLFEVFTVFGDSISPTFLGNYNKYSKTKKNKTEWFFHNNHLVVKSDDNMLETVMIKGVFEDPLDLAGLTQCEGVVCQDPYTTDFPIEGTDFDTLSKIVMQELNDMIKHPRDLVNDSNSLRTQP